MLKLMSCFAENIDDARWECQNLANKILNLKTLSAILASFSGCLFDQGPCHHLLAVLWASPCSVSCSSLTKLVPKAFRHVCTFSIFTMEFFPFSSSTPPHNSSSVLSYHPPLCSQPHVLRHWSTLSFWPSSAPTYPSVRFSRASDPLFFPACPERSH